MKISRAWLQDFVDLSGLPDDEVSELLTTRVAEVEDVIISGQPLQTAVLAEVISIQPHPKSKKLQLVEINFGGAKTLKIVCGAKNPKVGLKTAFVPVGGFALLGESLVQVTAKEVAGVLSEGMLASLKELDVLGESDGIFDFDSYISDTRVDSSLLKVGEGFAKIFGEPDTIFEIDNKSLTHRPDLWGHYGFARELSSILNKPLKIRIDDLSDYSSTGKKSLENISSKSSSQNNSSFNVSIEGEGLASRFSLFQISNVKVLKSAPKISRRLYSVGASSRNIIVDLSNYVMLETGQPNHTYDLEKVSKGNISVRSAREKERFTALDDKDYELSTEDIVIADSSGPIALAGVIGGKDSAISVNTENLLFESGCFSAISVRQSSKRLSVRTDASNRFEKNRTPYAVPLASLRFLELLKEFQPKISVSSEFMDSFNEVPPPNKITLSKTYINERLGSELSFDKTNNILNSLGFESSDLDSGEVQYDVPWYRTARDVSIPEDLVEEVGRIFAYDNIEPSSPKYTSKANALSSIKSLEYNLADLLRGMGFCQYESISFSSPEFLEKLGFDSESFVSLKNPIDSNNSVLRASLVPGMIESVVSNKRYFKEGLLFETGRVYEAKNNEKDKKSPPCTEGRRLSFLLSHFESKDKKGKLFFQARSVLSQITNLLTGSSDELKVLSFTREQNSKLLKNWMHPYRSGVVTLGQEEIGIIAEPKSSLTEGLRAVFVELDTEKLNQFKSPRIFKAISKFPESYFEISVVAKKGEVYSDIEDIVINSVPAELLKGSKVLSVYSGSPLKEGEQSISIQLRFGSDARTLSSDELEELQSSVLAEIDKSSFRLRT